MKNKKKPEDYVKHLKDFVEECFEGNNEVNFFISERGHQRIEVKDLDTGEVFETLECVQVVEDMSDYNEIAHALLGRFVQYMNDEDE